MPLHLNAAIARRLAFVALPLSLLLAACGRRDARSAQDRDDSRRPPRAPATDTESGCAASPLPPVDRQGIGTVRLGAPVRATASGCPRHDTTWSSEGMEERGTVIVLGGHPLLAVTTSTADTSVARVIVRDPAYRTEGRLGVGSPVGELRRAFGSLCVTNGEGRVVAIAPSLAGVSFVTDAPFGASRPRLADSARVTELIVHGNTVRCAETQ